MSTDPSSEQPQQSNTSLHTKLLQFVDIFPTIDTFVFDVDSTILTCEVLDEFASFCDTDVTEITNRAMSGEISFAQALIDRIEIMKLRPNDYPHKCQEFLTHLKSTAKLTPNFIPFIQFLYQQQLNVYFVSGGFKPFIIELFQHLFPIDIVNQMKLDTNVYANEFTFDGEYISVDTTLFTSQTNGKSKVLQQLINTSQNNSNPTHIPTTTLDVTSKLEPLQQFTTTKSIQNIINFRCWY